MKLPKLTSRIAWIAALTLPSFGQNVGPKIEPAQEATGQESAGQDEEKKEKPSLEELNPISPDERTERLMELFAEVELRLARIDDLLTDASAGETSKLGEALDSGIEKLLDEATPPPSGGGGQSGQSGSQSQSGVGGMLQRSSQEGRAVLQGIDEIIEVASQP